MSTIKESKEICSICAATIEPGYVYECNKCGDPLCPDCTCPCSLGKIVDIDKEFDAEVEEDEEEYFNKTLYKENDFPTIYPKKFEKGLVEGADLNLDEVSALLENISLDYYATMNMQERDRLSIQYAEMARHYNKLMGTHVITECL